MSEEAGAVPGTLGQSIPNPGGQPPLTNALQAAAIEACYHDGMRGDQVHAFLAPLQLARDSWARTKQGTEPLAPSPVAAVKPWTIRYLDIGLRRWNR